MKRATILLLSVLIMMIGLSVSAHAMLVPMGDGTIYDTDKQLSWLQDAGAGGVKNWAAANTWVNQLNTIQNIYGVAGYAGRTNWRLPNADPGCGINYNCTNSEMGHLYYTELGNLGYCDASGNCPQAGWGLTHTGSFTNLQPDIYWSGTAVGGPSHAWAFDFTNGGQAYGASEPSYYAWAVSPGCRPFTYGLVSGICSTPVPASGTVGLIVLGLAGVITYGMRLRKAPR